MLQLMTFTAAVQRFAAACLAQAGSLLDFSTGTVELALAQAVSSVVTWLQWLIVQVLLLTRAATSTGTDLDSWMADFGVTRLAATDATGQVTFGRFTATSSALVSVGAAVKTADGTQTFMVVADTTQTYWNSALSGYLIPAGIASGIATVEAVNAGYGGNVQAGAISLLASGISGIDFVNNADAFTNALNAESDTAFRSRFQLYMATLSKATRLAVFYACSSVQQGLAIEIDENWNGTAYAPGSFVVTVDDGSGSPPTNLLTSLTAAVDAIRPLCSTFWLRGPTIVHANVSMTIYGNDSLTTTVQTAITAYIDALAPNTGLSWSQLFRVAYAVDPTITNVSALLLNGGTSDIAAVMGQSVKAGTITINPG